MHPLLRRTALVLGATLLTGLVGPAQGAGSTPAAAPARAAGTPAGRPATPAEPLTPVHGARGIGDPYFPLDGNGGYDVEHYDIHDTYRVRAGDLTGWTVLTARATEDLASFSLDLVLDPRAVSVDGLRATYTKDGRHELVVTPAAPVPAGSTFRVRVDYTGRPRDTGWQGQRPFLADRTEAMAMNEPHVAPWWFPANDHPTDKATFDIAVRVPAGQQVLSNGEQVGRTDTPVWTTWHWRMRRPMSTYLAFFAAGRFRVERGTSNGLPWVNAVSRGLYPRDQDQQLRLLRSTPGIVAWLETQLGDYPFDSTGGVVTALFTGFALENQGRPTYSWLGGGPQARSTVVHELAHQWFGDQVSVRRWRDIWLNEGFASWAEWRYDETHGGRTAMSRLHSAYAARPARDPFWRIEIGRPGAAHLFDEPVYDRGAMALEALRQRLGTPSFLRLLRTWVAGNAYGSATVEEFEALAEQVSGEQLGGFFTAWLRSGTRPADTVANGLR